jgi:hypothetical protein
MKYLLSFAKSIGALLAVVAIIGVIGLGAFAIRHPQMFQQRVGNAAAPSPTPAVAISPSPDPLPSPIAPPSIEPIPVVPPPMLKPPPVHAITLPPPHIAVGSSTLFSTGNPGSGSFNVTNSSFYLDLDAKCLNQDGAQVDPNGSVVTVRWTVAGDTRTYSQYWGDITGQFTGPATVTYSISVRGTCSWHFWIRS